MEKKKKSKLRKSLKYIYKNQIFFYFISNLGSILLYLYLRVVFFTSRKTYIFPENINDLMKQKIILCFWHGRLTSPFLFRRFAPKKKAPHVILSKSQAAHFIYLLVRLFRVKIIQGSTNTETSNKGGAESLRGMIDVLNKGHLLAIASDGPVGPRMRASTGTAFLSLLSKAPILPLTISGKKAVVAKSWDRFLILLPFSKITLKAGEPIYPFKEGKGGKTKKDIEEYRKEIEKNLNTLTWELDKENGIKKINFEEVNKRGKAVKIKNRDITL